MKFIAEIGIECIIWSYSTGEGGVDGSLEIYDGWRE